METTLPSCSIWWLILRLHFTWPLSTIWHRWPLSLLCDVLLSFSIWHITFLVFFLLHWLLLLSFLCWLFSSSSSWYWSAPCLSLWSTSLFIFIPYLISSSVLALYITYIPNDSQIYSFMSVFSPKLQIHKSSCQVKNPIGCLIDLRSLTGLKLSSSSNDTQQQWAHLVLISWFLNTISC